MALGRHYYIGLTGGPQTADQNFTGAATEADVVAGDSTKKYKVDRIIVAAGGSVASVHLEDGGTQKGPVINCPANDTVIVPVIIDYADGAGIDIEATAACDVHLNYHEDHAGD